MSARSRTAERAAVEDSILEEEISDKGFVPMILLSFFLGAIGVHRFYAGKIGTGILQLLTLGGLGIWTMIDFPDCIHALIVTIALLTGSFRDGDGKVVTYPGQKIHTNKEYPTP